MENIYSLQTKGKVLFYAAAFICFISLVGIPIGILFVIMAVRAKIILTDKEMIYTMLRTKNIPYSQITRISLSKAQTARYYVKNSVGSGTSLNLVTVIPLVVETKDQKIKLSANFFDNTPEMIELLLKKTKLNLES